VIVGDRVILPGSPDYPRNPQPGSAAAPAGARLSIFVEGRRYLDFTLDCDETRIGRRGHGSRPDIDLSVIDPEKRLSRRHLLLHRTDGQFYARNESGRGTVHVDGKALAQGAEHPLTDGAQLVLDKFVGIVFRAPGGGGRA
jgi:pSer/pThr/pTyr-binding forkhead associated (FHA) protein